MGWLGKQNPHKDLVSAGSGAVLVFGEQTLCALLWQDRLTSRVCSLHCREEVGLFLSLLLKGYATLGSLLNFSEPQFPHMETIIGPESTPRAEEDNACKLPMDVCTVCDKPARAGKSGAWGSHALIRTASKML